MVVTAVRLSNLHANNGDYNDDDKGADGDEAPVVQMAYLPLRPNLFCLKSDQKKKNRFEILE